MEAMKQCKIICALITLLNLAGYSQDLYQDHYPNKTLKSEGLKKGDLKEGEWKYYYPNGTMMARENYAQGNLHGKVEYFFNDKTLQAIENWRSGALEDSA